MNFSKLSPYIPFYRLDVGQHSAVSVFLRFVKMSIDFNTCPSILLWSEYELSTTGSCVQSLAPIWWLCFRRWQKLWWRREEVDCWFMPQTQKSCPVCLYFTFCFWTRNHINHSVLRLSMPRLALGSCAGLWARPLMPALVWFCIFLPACWPPWFEWLLCLMLDWNLWNHEHNNSFFP